MTASLALPWPADDPLNREADYVRHIELGRLRTPLKSCRVTPGSFGPAYLRSLQVLSVWLANFLHVSVSFVARFHALNMDQEQTGNHGQPVHERGRPDANV